VGSLRHRTWGVAEESNPWDRWGNLVRLFSGGCDKLWTHHVISPAIEAMAEAIATIPGFEASDA
jgi:hypothetical protein